MNLFFKAWHAGQPSKMHAVRSLLETLANTIARIEPQYLVIALDGGHRARGELYPAYKAGRPPKPEGMLEQIQMAVMVFLELGWPTLRIIDWEADDVLASFAMQLQDLAECVVLITGDKDAIQCKPLGALIHHPWGNGQTISEEMVVEKYKVGSDKFGDFLALQGDPTDGIPGVAKVGPGTAAKLLAEHGSLDAILEAARVLKISGVVAKNLREQADVARLSRRLVELNGNLPIGRHWIQWPVNEPRFGWREALQRRGLGSVAQKLMEVLPAGRDRGDQSSHLDIEYAGVIESTEPLVKAALVPVTDAEALRSQARELVAEQAAFQEEMKSSAAELQEICKRSPIRQSARRVYQQAIAARVKHGAPAAGGYQPGTLLCQAWDAGSEGLPFESIDLTAFDHFGKPVKNTGGSEQPPVAPTKKPASLFPF